MLFQMKKEPYKIVKEVVSKEIAQLCYEYLVAKKEVASYLHKDKFIPPFDETFGIFTDEQAPGAFSIYGDILIELLLQKAKPIIEHHTNLKVIETYGYARVYHTGNDLARHTDRESCEVSATLNLGGDPWPIFIEGSGKTDQPGTPYTLAPGEMLIYDGSTLEHWREPFKGKLCGQAFFHYNDLNSKTIKTHKYDGREILGLPPHYRKERPTHD